MCLASIPYWLKVDRWKSVLLGLERRMSILKSNEQSNIEQFIIHITLYLCTVFCKQSFFMNLYCILNSRSFLVRLYMWEKKLNIFFILNKPTNLQFIYIPSTLLYNIEFIAFHWLMIILLGYFFPLCCSRKYSHPSHRRFFWFESPIPLEILVLVHSHSFLFLEPHIWNSKRCILF